MADTGILISTLLAQENDHALILLDTKARVIGWHMAAERLFGYARAEILGEPVDRLFVPEDRARGEPQLELALAMDVGKAEDDRWSLRKDETRFWANGIMTALRDERNVVIGFCKVVRDRTDVKAQIDTYVNRIAALETGEDLKAQFIATLAHELRNPLSVVATATQVLSRMLDKSPEHVQVTSRLQRQVDYMQKIMEDLFESARLAHGKVKLELAAASLRLIVDRAAETAANSEQNQQRVHVLYPSGDIIVSADATKLQQAVANLVANALKFSPPDTPVFVKATVEGDHAVVRIEDRGRGIAPDVLPHIFEMFTQAGGQTERQLGIGLGLGIVKAIVEMHGGTVHARSDGEGLGSEFIVRIPLA